MCEISTTGSDVGGFQRTLLDVGLLHRLRLLVGRIEACALLLQRVLIVEADQLELAELSFGARDGAVIGDMDVAVVGGDGDLAAVALQQIAVLRSRCGLAESSVKCPLRV